jgi:hypothetical protein
MGTTVTIAMMATTDMATTTVDMTKAILATVGVATVAPNRAALRARATAIFVF